MEMEASNGLTELHTKAPTIKGKNMGTASILGPMVQSMKGIGCVIRWKEKENVCGSMVEHMKENGKMVRCMGKESTFGVMVKDTKVHTTMERNMDGEYTTGEGVKNTWDVGKMVEGKVKGSTMSGRVNQGRVYGRKIEEFGGYGRNDLR